MPNRQEYRRRFKPILGIKRNGKRRVCIDFSEKTFCYFKYLSDTYKVSFNYVVSNFLDDCIEVDKMMAMDDLGIENDIRKKTGLKTIETLISCRATRREAGKEGK